MLGEIRHASKHLKNWMAPRRVATALQFIPARNRLIPQPLGVVGIIAPWNYPLQLTLAPAVGALAAGNRVMIKPSELVPRFSALLKEVMSARFDAAELVVTGIDERYRAGFCVAAVRSSDLHRLDPCRAPGGGSRRTQPDADHA